MVKTDLSFWRLFGCGLALVARGYCLRVALDDHWLQLGNLLLCLGVGHVSRWRSDLVESRDVVHSDSDSLALLGRVVLA